MLNKRWVFSTLFFIGLLFCTWLLTPSPTLAQSCSGTANCCGSFSYYRIPEGCSETDCPPDDPDCVECTGVAQGECLSTYTDTCEYNDVYGGCTYNCPQGIVGPDNCTETPAEPPPTVAQGYSCTDPSGPTCTLVAGGGYADKGTCEDDCAPDGWTCVNPDTQTCQQTGGPYTSQTACLSICRPQVPCGGLSCGDNEVCCDGGGNPFCMPQDIGCGGQYACDPAADFCFGPGGPGNASVPGASGTGCSDAMVVESNSPGTVTLRSVKIIDNPDYDPNQPADPTNNPETITVDCAADWSNKPLENGGNQYPGLIIWEYTNEATKFQQGGVTWPGYSDWEATTIIPNGQASITFAADTGQTHYYLVTPACTTGNRYYTEEREAGAWSAERWATLEACHRTVEFCAPNCANQCGQPDGCGSVCGDDDLGVPGLVTINQPSANPIVLSGSTTITISWTNTDSKTDSYDVVVFNPEIYTGNLAAAAQSAWNAIGNNPTGWNHDLQVGYDDWSDPNAFGTYLTDTSINFDFSSMSKSPLAIAVRPVNSTCSPQNGGWMAIEKEILSNGSGGFYIDGEATLDANNLCIGETSIEASLDGVSAQKSTMTALNTNTGDTILGNITGSTYSLENTLAQNEYVVTLNLGEIDRDKFVCSCPTPILASNSSSCTLAATTPFSDVNFFFSLSLGPWWQTRSGLAHAESNITSNLPFFNGSLTSECAAAGSPNCAPYLVSAEVSTGDLLTSGFASANNFTVEPGYLSEQAGGPFVEGHSDASASRDDFTTLSRRFDLTAATQITDGSISNLPATILSQEDAKVLFKSGDLTIAIDEAAPWNITAGEKIVLFVDGNILFDSFNAGPFISVEEGGFFAVVASGNIDFEPEIGYELTPGDPANELYNLTPNFEGVYVASGALTIKDWGAAVTASDRKFVGAGSFVGWSGVNLPRDFESDTSGIPFAGTNLTGTLNNSVPTETFIFRPDFVRNTPELMKKTNFTWRELTSFEE